MQKKYEFKGVSVGFLFQWGFLQQFPRQSDLCVVPNLLSSDFLAKVFKAAISSLSRYATYLSNAVSRNWSENPQCSRVAILKKIP